MTTVMTQIINEKLIEDVKGSIREIDRELLVKLTDEMRPADLADLIEHLDTDERLFIFELFEPEEPERCWWRSNPLFRNTF